MSKGFFYCGRLHRSCESLCDSQQFEEKAYVQANTSPQPNGAFVNNEFIIVSLHLVFQNLTETKVFDASLLLVKEGN